MPMLANVRSIPEAMPNMSGGAAFMIAELLAGKNMLVPTPLTRLMATITQSGGPRPAPVPQPAGVEADAARHQIAGHQQQRRVDRGQSTRPLQVHQHQE